VKIIAANRRYIFLSGDCLLWPLALSLCMVDTDSILSDVARLRVPVGQSSNFDAESASDRARAFEWKRRALRCGRAVTGKRASVKVLEMEGRAGFTMSASHCFRVGDFSRASCYSLLAQTQTLRPAPEKKRMAGIIVGAKIIAGRDIR
jgi:hypothetical protein